MRWEDLPQGDASIEDRRSGDPGNPGSPSLGGMPIPGGPGGLSIGTIVVLGLIGWALGIDPRTLIGGAEIITGGRPSYESPQTTPRPRSPNTATRTGVPSDEM